MSDQHVGVSLNQAEDTRVSLASIAARIASATISQVPGCASCPLTTTEQPAARAEGITSCRGKANGKFEAPNRTGPPDAEPSLCQVVGEVDDLAKPHHASVQVVPIQNVLSEQSQLACRSARSP